MSKFSFTYWAKKGGTPESAVAGETISILENVEYVLEFSSAPKLSDITKMSEIGYDPITTTSGILCFRNYVGTAFVGGVTLRVLSTKLGPDGLSRLLEEVSTLSAGLIFGWRAPTSHGAMPVRTSKVPIPYHQLQFLRQVLLRNKVGTRMQDHLHAIENGPTQHFVAERPLVGIERARRLDEHSIREIFTRTGRLAVVPLESSLCTNAIAAALEFGTPPRRHFPLQVSEAARKFSYDTVENRFVKHFIEQSLAVVYKFLDHQGIHAQMRTDCRAMATDLEIAASARYLAEVKPLSSLPSPTQVMIKSEGYREIWSLWQNFRSYLSLPTNEANVERFLQGRDIAQLYEYWVFLKILEVIFNALNANAKGAINVKVSDLGESMDRGLSVRISELVSLSFNPSFTRGRGNAYSTPLRPDVVLEISGKKYIFDAKYRLKWKDLQDDTSDDESTFLRTDLYKMHTYRDAIRQVEAAFVVYPGSEFGFYEYRGVFCRNIETVTKFDGVGAIPANPDADVLPSALSVLVTKLLSL